MRTKSWGTQGVRAAADDWQGLAALLLSVLAMVLAFLIWLLPAAAGTWPSAASPHWLRAWLFGHSLVLVWLGSSHGSGPLPSGLIVMLRCTTVGLAAICGWLWLRQGSVSGPELAWVGLQGTILALSETRPRAVDRRGRGQASWLVYTVSVALAISGSAAVDRASSLDAPMQDLAAEAGSSPSGPLAARTNLAVPLDLSSSGEAASRSERRAVAAGDGAGGVLWQDQLAARAAEAATVRVVDRTQGQWGSGTIVAAAPGAAYVLTASHLVAGGEQLVIERGIRKDLPAAVPWGTGDGQGAAELVLQDVSNDLALLHVPLRRGAALPATLPVCPLSDAPATARVDVLVVSSSERGLPQSIADTVTAKRIRRRPGGEILAVWEGGRAGGEGDSGGALVDRQGRLIGVRSGIGDGRSYYCHLAGVHRFLDRWDLPLGNSADKRGSPPPK